MEVYYCENCHNNVKECNIYYLIEDRDKLKCIVDISELLSEEEKG